MSETHIQTSPPLPRLDAALVEPPSIPPAQADGLRIVKKGFQALASLRLTVFLFVLSMFLVFTGTLAMRDSGLWVTLSGYFRCWIAWIPLQVFVPFGQVFFGMPQNLRIGGGFYFPGGWTIGAALLLNLLAAHALRFQFLKRAPRSSLLERADKAVSPFEQRMLRIRHFILYRIAWKRSGILMIHSGLVLLMLGEFVTGNFAEEASMPIKIGDSANYLQHSDRVELAFTRDDPEDPNRDRVVVIPDSVLRKGGRIDNALLPFKIEIIRFMANADLHELVPGEQSEATRGAGLAASLVELPQSSGADSSQRTDAPGAYATLYEKNSGKKLGTYLLWVGLGEQEVKANKDAYRLDLRYERSYQPYQIYLEEFHHDVYPGTEIPKNFSSRIRLMPNEGDNREVVVYMNNPLRFEGQTFYQSGVLQNNSGTILQVVHNPGADMPYVSCTLICVGMLIHFGLHLQTFLQRRTAV
jgi:hypothetical protein